MPHSHTPIEELPTNGDPEFGKHDVHTVFDVAATAPLYLLAPLFQERVSYFTVYMLLL